VHLVFSRRIQANLQFLILGCKIACLFKSSLTMSQELSYSDVSSHSSKKDLYVVIHDKVYNASSFIDEHP
jgi:cytochrome b involved in lipid metabolism